MPSFRLRTQLLIAALLIILGLTGSIIFFIRHTVNVEIQRQVRQGTEESVRAFETEQRQREQQLSRTAAMLADLPTLKALMSTGHAPTIQDGSERFWKTSGSDLLILAKPDRKIVGMHMTNPDWSLNIAQRELTRSLELGEDTSWWYDNGRLYWVFLHPIYSGAGSAMQELGLLAVGYQLNSELAQHLAATVGNQIVLTSGETVIASTLKPEDEDEFRRQLRSGIVSATGSTGRAELKTDQYVFSSVRLTGSSSAALQCYVMMPLEQANGFIKRLNLTIYVTAALAVLFGVILFGFVARTVTLPLDNLVAGVKALAGGDYSYNIEPRGSAELVELSTSFSEMRHQLQVLQQQRIDSERISSLARAASSISHDLRHYLAAVVANAEFLYEADELKLNKSEIYEEIKTAANQMTDLIDSLRELSHERSVLTLSRTRLDELLRRAIEAVHARPELRHAHVALTADEDIDVIADPRKLERVFFNLILNACEAASSTGGLVSVEARETDEFIEIRIRDNGRGIPNSIRKTLFDPFVSFGKPNGTGLGLAIVSKIIEDHSGRVLIEETSNSGTTMLVRLPYSEQSTPRTEKTAHS